MQNQSQKHRNNYLVSFLHPRNKDISLWSSAKQTFKSFMLKSLKHQFISQKNVLRNTPAGILMLNSLARISVNYTTLLLIAKNSTL